MNTIKFNNTTFPIESYNRNTYLVDDNIHGDGNCIITVNNLNTLIALMQTPITLIEIYHNETLIYTADNLNAYINNISEYLSDNRVVINLSLTFDNVESDVV